MRRSARPDAEAEKIDTFCDSVPILTMSSSVSRFLENFRMVRRAPESESGAMTALTRLPSGEPASTIGDDSSTAGRLGDDLVDDPAAGASRR